MLLYELLTGARPLTLEGKTPLEVERALTAATISPPSRRLKIRHGDDLDSIVLTALRAQPERRYASAGQLGEDIARFLDGQPVLAKPDTLAYRARRFVGRNRATVAAAALFVASLAGFGVVAGWQAERAAAQRDAARGERDKAEQVVGVLVDLFESSNPTLHPDGDKVSVRQFLLDAEPRVLERLQGQPAIRARLQQVFGLMFAARDQYREAEEALEQALDEQRRLLGPDHPDAIESLYQLGVLFEQKGNEVRARPLLAEALERCRRVYGEEHAKTARSLATLVSDSLEEGRANLEQALAIRRRVLAPNHPDIAENLAQLAQYHDRKGDMPKARLLYAEALAAFPTPAERRHATAIRVLSDYAALLGAMNEYAEAEALLRESLLLAREIFGSDSMAVAQRLNNLAVNLVSQGHPVEAEQLFREAYQRHAAVLGEEHWRTSNVARNVGAILALQQRYPEALPWLDRALAGVRRSPSPTNARLELSLEGRRAVILLRLGRGAEAITALESAAAALLAANRDDTRAVQTDIWMFYALALIETGRPADAEAPARQALAALDPLGASHPNRACAECLLGWALVLTDRHEEGRAALAHCLPLYRTWGLADRPMVAAIDRLLAATAEE